MKNMRGGYNSEGVRLPVDKAQPIKAGQVWVERNRQARYDSKRTIRVRHADEPQLNRYREDVSSVEFDQLDSHGVYVHKKIPMMAFTLRRLFILQES